MKQPRWVLLSVIAACCAIALVLWPRERKIASAVPPSPSQPSEGRVSVRDDGLAAPVREQVVSATDPTAATEAEVVESRAAPARSDEIELSGHLTILDPEGRERYWAVATFRLIAWHDDGGWNTEVRASEGAWKANATSFLGPITHVTFDEFVVDGSRATLEAPSGRIVVPADRRLDLRVRLPRRTILRVLGGDTGADLERVVLVRPAAMFPRSGETHPGVEFDERVLADDQRSPIDLERRLGAVDLRRYGNVLVGSEGYAWSLVGIDVEHGGERTVTLERAGGVDLYLIGAAALPGEPAEHAREPGELVLSDTRPALVELRLNRGAAGTNPLLSMELRGREQVGLDGLAAGHYRAAVEVGDFWNIPGVLGSAEFDVVADARASATLVIEPSLRVEAVRVSGHVWVPSAWSEDQPMVTMQLLDTALYGFERYQRAFGQREASEREGYDRFDWALSQVQPGRYELGVFRPSFSVAIVVEPRSDPSLDLVVPPPVQVSLRVVDADSGLDVAVDGVMWHPERPPGVSGGGCERVQRSERTQRYEFRAAAGAIVVWAGDQRFTMVDGDLAASGSARTDGGVHTMPGRRLLNLAGERFEATLRVRPNVGFVLRIQDGDTHVPIPGDWHAMPQAVSGGGCAVARYDNTFEQRFVVSEPGEYALELPGIAGYAPIPVQRVTVGYGEFIERVVQLVREP